MTITTASDAPYQKYEVIPTGLKLDAATGIGGVPTRRVTEIYGPPKVGKSTLALMLIASAQKDGKKCLWLDQEFTFDFEGYAELLGIDMKKLMFVREQIAENALDDALSFAADEKNGLIVIDSIGALQPRIDAEKTSDGKSIGSQSKLVSGFLRRITPYLMINNHALVVINHSFIDVMHGNVKTSGGAKLDYQKALSISLKRLFGKSVTKGADGAKVGYVVEAEIQKNKLRATEGTKAELMMIPGSGFSKEHDLLQDLLASGEVVKKGNTYWRGSVKLGVGLTKAREALKDHAK